MVIGYQHGYAISGTELFGLRLDAVRNVNQSVVVGIGKGVWTRGRLVLLLDTLTYRCRLLLQLVVMVLSYSR